MSEKKTIYMQITLQRAVTMCLGDEMKNLFVANGDELVRCKDCSQTFYAWVHDDFYEKKEVTVDEN